MSSSLYLDQVPVRWAKLAYPSMLPLTAWITDLQQRHKELDVWLVDFQVFINALYSTPSYLRSVLLFLDTTVGVVGWIFQPTGFLDGRDANSGQESGIAAGSNDFIS